MGCYRSEKDLQQWILLNVALSDSVSGCGVSWITLSSLAVTWRRRCEVWPSVWTDTSWLWAWRTDPSLCWESGSLKHTHTHTHRRRSEIHDAVVFNMAWTECIFLCRAQRHDGGRSYQRQEGGDPWDEVFSRRSVFSCRLQRRTCGHLRCCSEIQKGTDVGTWEKREKIHKTSQKTAFKAPKLTSHIAAKMHFVRFHQEKAFLWLPVGRIVLS